jgi:hypothetical protein
MLQRQRQSLMPSFLQCIVDLSVLISKRLTFFLIYLISSLRNLQTPVFIHSTCMQMPANMGYLYFPYPCIASCISRETRILGLGLGSHAHCQATERKSRACLGLTTFERLLMFVGCARNRQLLFEILCGKAV